MDNRQIRQCFPPPTFCAIGYIRRVLITNVSSFQTTNANANSYQKLYLRNCTNTNVIEPKSEIYHLTFILPVMPEVIRTDRMHDNTWNVRLT